MALLHLQCSLQSNLKKRSGQIMRIQKKKTTHQSHTALLTQHNTFHTKT